MNDLKKDNILLIALLGIIILVTIICGYFAFTKDKIESKTDAIKMKEEYAELNGKINEKNTKEYPIVELADENPFVYKTGEEMIDILENKTGVIYFGFPTCPWCRSLLPILEKAAKSQGIGEVYYLNIYEIRSTLSLDENNKVITEKEGSEDYYRILDLLKDYLTDYTLSKDGKSIKTDEKRLYAPTVVVVDNGKIVGFHEGTLSEAQPTGYEKMTDEEKEQLQKILEDMMSKINTGVCTSEGC